MHGGGGLGDAVDNNLYEASRYWVRISVTVLIQNVFLKAQRLGVSPLHYLVSHLERSKTNNSLSWVDSPDN